MFDPLGIGIAPRFRIGGNDWNTFSKNEEWEKERIEVFWSLPIILSDETPHFPFHAFGTTNGLLRTFFLIEQTRQMPRRRERGDEQTFSRMISSLVAAFRWLGVKESERISRTSALAMLIRSEICVCVARREEEEDQARQTSSIVFKYEQTSKKVNVQQTRRTVSLFIFIADIEIFGSSFIITLLRFFLLGFFFFSFASWFFLLFLSRSKNESIDQFGLDPLEISPFVVLFFFFLLLLVISRWNRRSRWFIVGLVIRTWNRGFGFVSATDLWLSMRCLDREGQFLKRNKS